MLTDIKPELIQSKEPEIEDWIVTSHSIDGTFDSCPRRFEFKHVIGMVPDSDETGWAAEIGTALHEAVQEWSRSGRDEKAGLWTLLLWWPWNMEVARRTDGSRADNRRSLGQAILLYERIISDPFWDDWDVARLPDGSHAIEVPFRINHRSLGGFIHPRTGRNCGVATQGKMDWILRNRHDQRLAVADLKTTIMPDEAQAAAFRFSGQGGGYGMVLSAAVGHDWKKHGVEVWYLCSEFGADGPEFQAFDGSLTPEEVQDAIDVKVDRIERMLSMARAKHWHRKTHGCVFYAKPCGYIDVCHRREMPFLLDWFANEADRFKERSRIYDPYWTLED